jgi:hypothetical protein
MKTCTVSTSLSPHHPESVHSRVSESATNEHLRGELLERMARDVALRNELGRSSDAGLVRRMLELDAENTAWLKTILSAHGWPGFDLVGADGASAAWLLAQHADADRAFQAHCLELMRAAVDEGQADAKLLAYLTDRLRVANRQPQVYGTQMRILENGDLEPFEIEDAEDVDERRAAVGLEFLELYRKQMHS